MEKVSYAIIGFGGIAENRIAKEGFCMDRSRFEAHPAAELVGATDINGERKGTAEALGLKWYANEEEIFKDDAIEAVYVATNNSTHAEMALKVLESGKYCIIEKPIATKLEDAKRIHESASEKGLSVFVDHMMRKNAFNLLARERIEKKAIGTVNDINLHIEFSYGSTEEEAKTWRCAEPEELGGPIGDVASHCLYMGEFLIGSKVREIRCLYLPKTLKIKVENGAYVQLLFENGQQGTIRVAFNQPRGGLLGTLSNLGYEVYGTDGVIRGYATLFQLSGHKDEPVRIRLTEETANGLRELQPQKINNIYQSLIQDHAFSIREGKPPTGEDGLRNLEAVLACHESAVENGKKVQL